MDLIAQNERKNESGENPMVSSLLIWQLRTHWQVASSTSRFQPDDTIKKCLEQGDVEDVQGVLARDGREELATKNNTAVLLPAREVEVMEGDVKVVDFAELKVNLDTPDEISDSTDRGFAASKESSSGRAMFRKTPAEYVLPPKEPRIRDIKQRIFDRLATVIDGPELQRILAVVEGMMKEGVSEQLEKKIVKSTIGEKIKKENVDDQTKKEFVGSMVEVEREEEDTVEPLQDVFSEQALTVINPEKPEVQYSMKRKET
ncbi:hypothetical protein TSAR_003709 [Trichomalopsis sarcophagae]|uniref:Uncharacterized protein n=1 Tax=Trichomalopsis sarcophagae TaxID=543379 RepID=A0A232EHI9_9HYME|nr:hypothetical protein TSAR_003709 [Trichomalopsis sarcophagae]